jgi:hypothetical protein
MYYYFIVDSFTNSLSMLFYNFPNNFAINIKIPKNIKPIENIIPLKYGCKDEFLISLVVFFRVSFKLCIPQNTNTIEEI